MTFRRLHAVRPFLESLASSGIIGKYPIAIFEDCGNADSTAEWLTTGAEAKGYDAELHADHFLRPDGIEVFIGRRREGVMGQSNKAIRWFERSGHDHLCLCNDDMLATGDFVEEYAKGHKHLNVGYLTYCGYSDEVHKAALAKHRGMPIRIITRMVGAMTSMTLDVVKTVGYFDDRYGLFGEEHSLSGDMRVLGALGRWHSICACNKGDIVMGWTSTPDGFKFHPATVEATSNYETKMLQITLASGRWLRCTANHMWLTKSGFRPAKIGQSLKSVQIPTSGILHSTPDRIVEIRTLPDKMRAHCLTTSTGNYVAEGYMSHNCGHQNNARFAGFINLNGVPQMGLDIVSKCLTHQEVASSISQEERPALDREAAMAQSAVGAEFFTRERRRPYRLRHPERADGVGPGAGIMTRNLEVLGYPLIQDPQSSEAEW